MHGLEANGFGSMLRDAGIPPMAFDPFDFLDDEDYDDDDDEEEDFTIYRRASMRYCGTR